MQDTIEKTMDLKAPLARVWRALTDSQEFGKWFGVRIDGPFEVGQVSRGNMTIPGYEHLVWDAVIEKIEPQSLLVYRWHPYAVDAQRDYSGEERTVVEFHLEEIAEGTRLRVVESGFSRLSEDRRAEAFRANEGGWAAQMQNIAQYVAS